MSYAKYPCQIELVKKFQKGTLRGMMSVERMGFITWKDACTWAEEVSRSKRVPYIVPEIRNLKTNELKKVLDTDAIRCQHIDHSVKINSEMIQH